MVVGNACIISQELMKAAQAPPVTTSELAILDFSKPFHDPPTRDARLAKGDDAFKVVDSKPHKKHIYSASSANALQQW